MRLAVLMLFALAAHAESLHRVIEHGKVGQRVNVSGYVQRIEAMEDGRMRIALCDYPRSVPRKHYTCIQVEFRVPSIAWRMPVPGEQIKFRGAITKKE
jgi:hypothetical protein